VLVQARGRARPRSPQAACGGCIGCRAAARCNQAAAAAGHRLDRAPGAAVGAARVPAAARGAGGGAPEPMGATLLPAAVRAPAPHGAPPQEAAAPARSTPAAPAEPAATAKTPRRA
jgi:hypothetical protein